MSPRTDPTVGTKRIYEPTDPHDGRRVLVDRIWPRGVSKDREAHSARDTDQNQAVALAGFVRRALSR